MAANYMAHLSNGAKGNQRGGQEEAAPVAKAASPVSSSRKQGSSSASATSYENPEIAMSGDDEDDFVTVSPGVKSVCVVKEPVPQPAEAPVPEPVESSPGAKVKAPTFEELGGITPVVEPPIVEAPAEATPIVETPAVQLATLETLPLKTPKEEVPREVEAVVEKPAVVEPVGGGEDEGEDEDEDEQEMREYREVLGELLRPVKLEKYVDNFLESGITLDILPMVSSRPGLCVRSYAECFFVVV